ncbi:MAG: hypothetical protein FWF55_05935 [Treponema sp.]|nr:hypothetical protein [Treponema sp.]
MKAFKCALAVIAISILVFSCASSGGSSGEAGSVVPISWDFDDPSADTAGWRVATGEFWDYSGTAALSRDDATFGNGMLKFDVDFSANSKSEWSEPKIRTSVGKAVSLKGYSKFTFDIYYNPELSSSGGFNSKVIAQYGTGTTTESVGSVINAQDDAGNGFLKATVSLPIRSSGSMDTVIFSIAGYLTDYKGPVFFDNIRWE